jgi:hypothetical protein
MYLLADDAASTSATAHAALPYFVVALVAFSCLLWFVLQNSLTGSALGHALWGGPVALFFFCGLSALGLAYGLPTLYRKMGFNPFNTDFQTFGTWTGAVFSVLFFLLMLRRLQRMRAMRRRRGF